MKIRDDISQVSDLINHIEWLRKQTEVIVAMLTRPRIPTNRKRAVAEADDEYDAHPSKAPHRTEHGAGGAKE